MTYFNILSLLLLLVSGPADSVQNKSAVSLNRTRRLSHGQNNEETLRLAKYMVSLRTRTAHKYYGDNHFCGGVIIAPKLVLTSSHCLVSRNQRTLYPSRILLVVAGTSNRLSYQPGISFHMAVRQILVPENFTLRNEQDIGILLLKRPFPRNSDYIAIANLPMRPVKTNSMCTVTGWGRVFRSGPLSGKLLHITIQIINATKCAKMLGISKKDILCGLDRHVNSVQHPCGGDRGSPLMHGNTVYGIVSHIVGCYTHELPSVYTDVFYSINYIRGIMRSNRGHNCHVSFLVVFVHFVAFLFL